MDARESIGYIIANTGRRLSQGLTYRFQDYDITSEQWSLLNCLAGKDGISQKELALRVDKDPTNVTRILDQLERKRLIRREANREDRRSFLTYITEEGARLNRQLIPIEQEYMSGVLASVSEEELDLLRNIFARINHNAARLK